MASHLRRTDDLQRLKTRKLVLQNTDGTYPSLNGIPYITTTTGDVGVTDNATIDPNGYIIAPSITVGTATVLGNGVIRKLEVGFEFFNETVDNALQVNGNASVLGLGDARGITTTDYVDLISHDAPNLSTALFVQNQSLYWRDTAGVAQDVFGAAKQLAPVAAFTELESTADYSTVISEFNRLLQVLSNQHAFITYTPLTPIVVPMQTAQAVTFVVYPNGQPSLANSVTVAYPVNTGQTLEDTVLTLDKAFTATGIPIDATLSGGQVTITPLSGYSFLWKDGGTIDSGYRFSSHIGFDGFAANTAYSVPKIGAVITSPLSEPSIPGTPAVPIAGTVTANTIQVNVTPGGAGESAILYLNGQSIVSIDGTDGWSYTFTNLTPSTATTTTTYTIQYSYANQFDEGPLSGILTVDTASLSPIEIDLFDPTYSAEIVFKTPYNGGNTNGLYIPVLTIQPDFWPAALTDISQIKYITLEFSSQFTQPNYYDSDARLVLNLTQSSATETVVFYSYQNRVTVASDPTGVYNWVGSPDQAPSAGPSLVAGGPETISEQSQLEAFFGNGTGAIDKTKVLRFCWFCGYPFTFINNCSVTAFKIYYETLP